MENRNLLVERNGCFAFCGNTDEVFGPTSKGQVFWEWDRYKSGNPYAATKAGAEELCLAFANTYKMHIVVSHTMNILGFRQHPEKYLPSTVRKILAGETVTIHADPTCQIPGTRYYIHAREVARAIDFIMLNGVTQQKYNIVGEREVSNLELARKIADVLGKKLIFKLVNFHQSRPGHDLAYGLSGGKLEEMGFKRATTFEQTIKETVAFTLANKQWL